jgi:signal peptidase I
VEGPARGSTVDEPSTSSAAGSDDSRGGALGFLAELPALMLVAFVLAILLKTFLLQAFWIPSESMVPTLEVNDRVLVNKLTYAFRDPRRGDVVVFSDPSSTVDEGVWGGLWDSLTSGFGLAEPGEEDFIKRIIGLPGETVEVSDGVVRIDGEPVDEELAAEGGYLGGETDDYGPFTVPEGEYFVMGDNRPFSADSRSLLGTIPADHLIGRAFVLIWPLDRAMILSTPDRGVATAGVTPTGVTPVGVAA